MAEGSGAHGRRDGIVRDGSLLGAQVAVRRAHSATDSGAARSLIEHAKLAKLMSTFMSLARYRFAAHSCLIGPVFPIEMPAISASVITADPHTSARTVDATAA